MRTLGTEDPRELAAPAFALAGVAPRCWRAWSPAAVCVRSVLTARSFNRKARRARRQSSDGCGASAVQLGYAVIVLVSRRCAVADSLGPDSRIDGRRAGIQFWLADDLELVRRQFSPGGASGHVALVRRVG